MPLAEARRPLAAREDERQGVGLGLALGVLDREEEEGGIAQPVLLVRALVEAQDLADPDGARGPPLAAEPAVAREHLGEDRLQPLPARPFEKPVPGVVDRQDRHREMPPPRRFAFEGEPEEPGGPEHQGVGPVADGGKAGPPEELDRGHPGELGEIELERLGETREIGDD